MFAANAICILKFLKPATNSYFYPLFLIRCKGDVPATILIPHVLLMFLAMLLGNLAGIMAFFKYPSFKKYTTITLITL